MLVERIRPVALRRLVTIQADAALTDVAKPLSNTHISLVVVRGVNGAMVGVITKTDVVRQSLWSRSAQLDCSRFRALDDPSSPQDPMRVQHLPYPSVLEV